jgi:DUF1009 family protein
MEMLRQSQKLGRIAGSGTILPYGFAKAAEGKDGAVLLAFPGILGMSA